MTLGSFRVLINQSEVYGSGDVVLLFAIGTFKIKKYKIKQRRLAPHLNYRTTNKTYRIAQITLRLISKASNIHYTRESSN